MDLEINKRVRILRNINSLSQEQVANLMGMSPSTYSQMERSGKISAERIKKLAYIFQVDVRVLLYGGDEEIVESKSKGDVVELPALPHGMKYIPVDSECDSIVTIYKHFPKNKKKYFCIFLQNLMRNKIKNLPPISEY